MPAAAFDAPISFDDPSTPMGYPPTFFVPREDPDTFYVPGDTIGPVTGLNPHVALGYYPEDSSLAFWDGALWDDSTAVWNGVAPLTDVTCDLLSVALTEGRDTPLERFRPSTLTVTLTDPEGLYSPWRMAPTTAAFGAIRPGIDLVYWVDVPEAGDTIPRFRGIVTAIEDGFPDQGDQHTVVFHATDYLSVLAAFDGTEIAPVGAGETAGPRLNRIVQNTGWTGPTAFDVGTVALQATTLAKNALDEAGMVTDTEAGALWCNRDGVLTFRDKNGLGLDPHYLDVQAVFGDGVGTATTDIDTELCYTDLELASDTDRVRNMVTISNVGGTAVLRSDLTSIALYQAHTFQRLDLIHVDPAESVTLANHYLDVYAYASNRVDGLTVDLGALAPADAATVLDLDTLHMIEVRRRPEGFQVVANLQIQGLTENVSAESWTVKFRTFSAASVFDVARWDVDLWDTGLWGY